jgi:enediyne biosynthesis protein E4
VLNHRSLRRGALLALLIPAALAGQVRFEEGARAAGLTFRHQASKTSQKYLPETMGAGVAVLDYDGDGRLDVFLVNGAALADPMPPGARPGKRDSRYWNRLYRNLGEGRFRDVTEAAGLDGEGYGMGAAAADYDNDGHPDLLVTTTEGVRLYRNRGNGTFEDVTRRAGLSASGWTAGAAFFDFDRDGRLDLFVARYLDWSLARQVRCGLPERPGYCHPSAFRAVTQLLWRNRGNGTFEDISGRVGLGSHPGRGLGVAILDFDRDGWPDVAVANDSSPQQIFRNDGGRRLVETALELGAAFNQDGSTYAGMGIDASDFDNDGWPDLFVNALSLEGYVLLRNRSGEFEDVSTGSGLRRLTLPFGGWGTAFADFANAGQRDLFVAQGHVMDTIEHDQPSLRYLQPMLLLRRREGRFEDASRAAGEVFERPLAARGAAFADLDNDGRLDVIVNVNDGPALLLWNRTPEPGNWLMVRLEGRHSPRDGTGTRVQVTGDSTGDQWAFSSTAGSYLSANDPRLHFGLGRDRRVRIRIEWPSGAEHVLEDVEANQVVRVAEPVRE